MSQTNDADELEQYRGTAGAEVKTADVSSDQHALKEALGGDDSSKERRYDPKIAGERFVQFYDDTAASIREYLSNAETACIRRARHELLDAGFTKDEIPDETTELLEMAKEECGYEPIIEVIYNRKSDDTRLIISDNGIGISTEEYKVVQRIGYSTSHQEGSRLGNFGMGWMSGFQLTSINGMFKMFTKSYLTDETYGTVEYVANCEFLDAQRDDYGTTFKFPAFGEAAKSIDIPSKVNEFADGMVIPVLYRDFDDSGDETGRSDDYLPTRMEKDYADDSMVVVYENEFFKAVMSPDRKETGRGRTTYNISMPIRRNTDAFGSNKFNAPWKWDFRGKQEDGPIVACETEPSLVGQIPKEDTKYDRLMPELQEKCVPMSRVPDDAIVMPKPASSRDSFKGGHDDFWRHVSSKLRETWADIAQERFEELDSWQDFKDMEREDKEALFRAYSEFGPSYSDVEPDTVVGTLEDELEVTIDADLGMRLHEGKSFVNVVERDSKRAQRKSSTTRKKIWQVIDEAPDGVYMGVSVSQKKADIAWNLGDTHVVRLDSTSEYDELASSWGWEKLKELPSRNLGEKLPELDDSIIEQYESADASASNNTRATASTGGNGKDPETYRARVRVGANNSKYFSTIRVSDLVDTLEDDERFSSGHYSCKYIILCDDDTPARAVARKSNRSDDIAAMRAPKYVYNYLVGKQNVYESEDELYSDLAGVDVELSDGTTMDIQDLPSTDMLLCLETRIEEHWEDRVEELVELLGYDPDDYDRFTFISTNDLDGSWDVTTDATVVLGKKAGRFSDFDDYVYESENFEDLKFKELIDGMDKSSDEYEALFGYRYGNPDGDTKLVLAEIARDAGLTDE